MAEHNRRFRPVSDVLFSRNLVGNMWCSECIEACSEIIADVKSSKEDLLSPQARTFIEIALVMYVITEIRCVCVYQLISGYKSGSLKTG